MAAASNSLQGRRKHIKSDSQGEAESAENSSSLESVERREVLTRQPSYCKILNDLKGTEDNMKSEPNVVEVSTSAAEDDPGSSPMGAGSSGAAAGGSPSSSGVQTISINGQQYQIVSPSVDGLQTISVGGGGTTAAVASSSSGGLSGVGSSSGLGGAMGFMANEEASRKREIRLLKNREAARECRNKKKEYIKCLENRVAVLENQNKALIEELKSLKELYTGQKN